MDRQAEYRRYDDVPLLKQDCRDPREEISFAKKTGHREATGKSKDQTALVLPFSLSLLQAVPVFFIFVIE